MARNTPVRENIERYPDLIKISEMARNTPICENIFWQLVATSLERKRIRVSLNLATPGGISVVSHKKLSFSLKSF